MRFNQTIPFTLLVVKCTSPIYRMLNSLILFLSVCFFPYSKRLEDGINSNDSSKPVPEFIVPVFTKTSPKRSISLNRKRAFWLVFAKTGSIISGTRILYLHCKKGLAVFPSPAGMSLTKLFLGGNNLIIPA